MKKVMIADDSRPMVNMLRYLLESGGYSITCAQDGDEALMKLRGSRYDALVTDLAMPKMNGIELIRNIRLKNKYLPIVVLSAMETIDTAVEAMREGADDFVRKSTEDLGETLRFVIERTMERKKEERRLDIYESILPICMHCKKIHYKPDDGNETWVTIEEYFDYKRSGIDFSHGICPECLKKYYS